MEICFSVPKLPTCVHCFVNKSSPSGFQLLLSQLASASHDDYYYTLAVVAVGVDLYEKCTTLLSPVDV